MCALLITACGRPIRSAPVEPTRIEWGTYLGNVQRAGYAAEPVPDSVSVIWRAEVGRGLVSPLLVEGPLLLTGTVSRLLVAISPETGEHYWERRLDGSISGGVVRGTETLFVSTEDRQARAYAVEPRRGNRLWEKVVGSSPFAPLYLRDTLYVTTEGGNVYALAARSGQQLWKTQLGGAVAATPVAYDERILVATTRDTLYALERRSGQVVARAVLPAGVAAPPALRDEALYLPLHSGAVIAFEARSLRELWRASLGAPVLAAPVVAADGAIYLLTRTAEVWRVDPGQDTARKLATLGGAARSSLTLARDRLLVGRLDGALFALRLDGSVVWREDLDDSIWAPVAVRDGAVYVPLLRGTIVKLR